MLRPFAAALVASLAASAAGAAEPASRAEPSPTVASIDAAAPNRPNDSDPALIAKAETLLDGRGFSPGEIDGRDGDNFRNALRAFQAVNGLPVSGNLDPGAWSALLGDNPPPTLTAYAISEADVAGPFTKAIPARLVAMARLPGLSYTGPEAELAEKFHMSQALLRTLNPYADFRRAGTVIAVPDVRPMDLKPGRTAVEVDPPKDGDGPVAATIVVDKPARDVRVYDQGGKFLAFYPATIGSAEKPAPTGVFAVKGVAWNPAYHYDPKFAWKGVRTKRELTVAPGPNDPVGVVWIDLTAPSYGIHGTPAPEDIGKTESHGCVRLTNWDAAELAGMARPGTVVTFEDEDSPIVPGPVPVSEGKRAESWPPRP